MMGYKLCNLIFMISPKKLFKKKQNQHKVTSLKEL